MRRDAGFWSEQFLTRGWGLIFHKSIYYWFYTHIYIVTDSCDFGLTYIASDDDISEDPLVKVVIDVKFEHLYCVVSGGQRFVNKVLSKERQWRKNAKHCGLQKCISSPPDGIDSVCPSI